MSDATIEAGYDSSDPVKGNLFNFILIGSGALIGIVLLLLRVCCWRTRIVKSCLTKLYEKLFFNFFLRTSFEIYLEISVVYMIKMHDPSFNSFYDTLNTSLSIASLSGLLIFSLFIPVFLTCKKNQFKTPGFITKYGSLIQDMRAENVSTRFFFMLFTLRRLMIAGLIVFMADKSWAQIQILCLSCSF